MLYEGKEVAKIANLYGAIQHNMCKLLYYENSQNKKKIAADLLNQINQYQDSIPKEIRNFLGASKTDELHLEIGALERKCKEFSEKNN